MPGAVTLISQLFLHLLVLKLRQDRILAATTCTVNQWQASRLSGTTHALSGLTAKQQDGQHFKEKCLTAPAYPVSFLIISKHGYLPVNLRQSDNPKAAFDSGEVALPGKIRLSNQPTRV
jgi:hypothetical protein